jgi:hypothetical protein
MPADPRLHATHDAELVAAYAAGDATGADLAAAEDLVAGCAECATLHRDLRAIMAALPRVPAPARPRDFRLTPEQAVALRPRSGLRRLLVPLAGARFAFAGPAGAGLAALGLAGILLSGGLNVQPPQTLTTVDKSVTGAAPQAGAVASGVPGVDGAASAPFLASGPNDQAAPSAAASKAAALAPPASSSAPVPASTAPSTAPSVAGSAVPAPPSAGPSAVTPSAGVALRPMPSASSPTVDDGAGAAAANQSSGGAINPPAAPLASPEAAGWLDAVFSSTSPVVSLGRAFLVAGLLLAGIRWAALRFA